MPTPSPIDLSRLDPFVGGLGKAILRELKQDLAAVCEEDPLQGAANWLYQAIDRCMASDIGARLSIGYNRANRLFEHAQRLHAASQSDTGKPAHKNSSDDGDERKQARMYRWLRAVALMANTESQTQALEPLVELDNAFTSEADFDAAIERAMSLSPLPFTDSLEEARG